MGLTTVFVDALPFEMRVPISRGACPVVALAVLFGSYLPEKFGMPDMRHKDVEIGLPGFATLSVGNIYMKGQLTFGCLCAVIAFRGWFHAACAVMLQ